MRQTDLDNHVPESFQWSVVMKSVALRPLFRAARARLPESIVSLFTIAQLSYLELAKGFEPPTL